MKNIVKIAYVFLFFLALMTFWPLVVVLLAALAVFLMYTSMKTKHFMNHEFNVGDSQKNRADIIEAEYTEKEIRHD